MPEEDVNLLRRYVDEGCEDAFTEVVRRNIDIVYSNALRRVGGDAHLAHDVAQDVFVALARHAGSLSRYRILTGWFFTATRNAAANRVRGEVRRRQREMEAQTMQETLQGQDGDAVWSQMAPMLDHSLDALGERDRAALLLRFFEHRTLGEVGSAFRITEDAARMRIERALARLREQLARRGIRSTAAALGAAMTHHAVSAAPAQAAIDAAHSALATPVSAWARFADFMGSFRPLEVALLVGALLTIGSAIVVSGKAHSVTAQHEISVAADRTSIRPLEHSLTELPPTPPSTRSTQTIAAAPDRSSTETRLAGGRRAELRANYDPLYRALGLTPDQIDQLESILVPTLNSALWVFDLPAGPEQPPAEPRSETDRKLRNLLGEENYAQYRNYQRILPARTAVRQVASAVYLTEPISREKGERLTALLANASGTYQTGGDVQLAAINWNALIHSAQPLLSAAQLSALQAVQHRVAFDQALQQYVAQQQQALLP